MANLQDVYQRFFASAQASRALYSHCLAPRGLHTSAGIEASFLQVQKSWELFLEDLLLSILSNSNSTTRPLVPYFVVADIEVARKIILQDRPFLDWVNPDAVKNRFFVYLEIPNQIQDALDAATLDLKEIKIIRNFIAHSSKKAREDFEKMWLQKIGGNPTVTTASDFLLLTDPQNKPNTYFDRYVDVLEITSQMMTN